MAAPGRNDMTLLGPSENARMGTALVPVGAPIGFGAAWAAENGVPWTVAASAPIRPTAAEFTRRRIDQLNTLRQLQLTMHAELVSAIRRPALTPSDSLENIALRKEFAALQATMEGVLGIRVQ